MYWTVVKYLKFHLLELYYLLCISSTLTPSPTQPSLKKERKKKKFPGNKAPFDKLAQGHNVVREKSQPFQHWARSRGSGRISVSRVVLGRPPESWVVQTAGRTGTFQILALHLSALVWTTSSAVHNGKKENNRTLRKTVRRENVTWFTSCLLLGSSLLFVCLHACVHVRCPCF